MTRYFVSRHPGAIAWAQKHRVVVDAWVEHLDPNQVDTGDTVIGSLPVQLIAEVCARGASYLHLQIDLSLQHRGHELNADDLDALGARLVEYRAVVCEDTSIESRDEPNA